VQLSFGQGAGSAVVDGQRHQGIAAGTMIVGAQPVAGPSASLLFDISAGIGTVSLERYSP
jgi:hypothetical protein